MSDSGIVLWADKGSPLTPSEVDGNFIWVNDRMNSLYALFYAILNGDGTLKSPPVYWGGTSTTTSDDYVITLSPQPTALADLIGKPIYFIPDTANADENATITIDRDGVADLGPVSITKEGTTAIAAGDVKANAVTEVIYDGTRFQLKT